MNELYKKIESLCVEKGVTKAQMCKDVGISQGNISDLKHGRKASFSAKNMLKLSEYFNVPIEYLTDNSVTYSYNSERLTEIWKQAKESASKASLSVTPEEMSDLAETFNALRDRPEMKMLFKSAKNATKDQIEAVARMLDSFKQ